MSRKWRNFLIAAVVVVLCVAAIWLLSRGTNDFSA